MGGVFEFCDQLDNSVIVKGEPDLLLLNGLDSFQDMSLKSTFRGSNFNQDVNHWDVSRVTNMSGTFRADFDGEQIYNQPLDKWDVSKVTNFFGMFASSSENTSFNQDISGWNVESGKDFRSMFATGGSSSAFNQDLSDWDVSSAEGTNGQNGLDRMFHNITLSTENYDKLLNSWSQLSLANGQHFSGGNSKYSEASAEVRNTLVNVRNWVITDGGPE